MRGRALLRPAWALVALGAVLSGCGLSEYPYGYPGGYSYNPSYNSPAYYRGHHHSRPSSQPRVERWSQDQLRQHWINQSQRPR